MSRDLEGVYQALVGAFHGLELETGDTLTAEGHVTNLDAVTAGQCPYLAFGTGTIETSEWGSEDWTDEVRWTMPAQLIVQSAVMDHGAAMRSALTDIMQHSRRVRGLPTEEGRLSPDDGSLRYGEKVRKGQVEFLLDRKGPHIASIRVDGPFDSGRYVAQLLIRSAFLMNLDPRELKRAQVAVLGVRAMDMTRSDVDTTLPTGYQLPRFTDSERRATGRFDSSVPWVIKDGVPMPAPAGGFPAAQQGDTYRDRYKEMQVAPRTATVAVAGTSQMTGIIVFQDDATNNVTAAASWGTSNAGVATVSASGLVTGVGAGTATITGTYAGQSGTCTVTVS